MTEGGVVSEAERAARRVRELPPENVTVGLWLAAWTVFFPRERSELTARHDEYMLGPFIAQHGRKLLAAVTPLMAQQWAVQNPSQVRYLRLAWEKAVLMQLVPFNVWKVVEPPRRQRERRVVPTLDELDAALERARGECEAWWSNFADLLELTAFTGARAGGVARLMPGDIDLAERRVTLTEKGDKTRTVVLLPRAAGAAERALRYAQTRSWPDRARRRRDPLFLTKAGARHTRESLGRGWRHVRGDFDGPFHSLKHFAGTWLAAQGVDERDIAIQLGHTDRHGRPYTHLLRRVYVHPDHSQALARIDALVNE